MLQRFNFIILSVIALGVLLGCHRPDSNPELVDPIYLDLVKLKKGAESQLDARKKDLIGFQEELKKVQPQTGQIKYATKRVNEAQAEINRLAQMVDYYGVKIDSRREFAFKSYMAAFREKKDWPDPKEFDEYKTQQRLESSSRVWSQKQQIEAEKLKQIKKPGGGGAEGSH